MGSGKRKRKLREKQDEKVFENVEDISFQQVASLEDFENLRKQKRPNQKQYIVHNGMMIEID